MNEQTTKLIDQLSQKLGTTTEYLWSVLLKQASIDATITLIQFFLIGIFGYLLNRKHKDLTLKKKYDKYECTGYDHYDVAAIFPMVLLSIIFIIFVIAAFVSIDNVFNGFFNPEFWALHEILKHISK